MTLAPVVVAATAVEVPLHRVPLVSDVLVDSISESNLQWPHLVSYSQHYIFFVTYKSAQ